MGSEHVHVLVIAKRFGGGGATRATLRILEALEQHGPSLGIAAEGWALQGTSDRPATAPLSMHPLARVRRKTSRSLASARDMLPSASEDAILQLHSRADVWTGLGRELDRAAPDIVNLHWLGTGTLSIEEIGRIRRPVVWTLHDMWTFTGAEHYTVADRFQRDYARDTRPPEERGVDWNRRTWTRKRRHWRRPMHIVTPSRWLADCAGQSALTAGWPISVIPTPVDTSVWRPMEQAAARELLGLPQESRLVLFGADGGEVSRIKGADLLRAALSRLVPYLSSDATRPIQLAVFGGRRAWYDPGGPDAYPTHHLGRINDDRLLRAVYAAADVMIVPSRMDNFPNVALESLACGTPVVAFRIGGLADIVEDGVTGRLVEPFDVDGLARAIAEVVDSPRLSWMRERAMHRAVALYSPSRVASMYSEVFEEAHRSFSSRGSH
jgi:glycosyltransferase involved in cell wall biosynthesis